MIAVAEAQARLFALASPLGSETLLLAECVGRYLTENCFAKRTQPAADLSAMDGYAVHSDSIDGPWKLVGESAAGAPYRGKISLRETVRIFTGAHLPNDTNIIIIQEDINASGDVISLRTDTLQSKGQHIRRKGSDFNIGDRLLTSGQRMTAGAIAVAAMAGLDRIAVNKRPNIAIIATGNELVTPGAPCSDAQIPSSNSIMLSAMLSSLPCIVQDMGIVKDDKAALMAAISACNDADIIVTIGGASVGDHDLVRPALIDLGAQIDFWKVAMKPGKPLMAGRLGNAILLGLPGNPSSAFVTAFLFLLPLVRHLMGDSSPVSDPLYADCALPLAATDARAEYIRAVFDSNLVTPFAHQDSGMTSPLSGANALIYRPIEASACAKGAKVPLYLLDI